MTATMLIVAMLFGGLCWAGRRSRRSYVEQYTDDIDIYDDGCDDDCSSESYDSYDTSSEDRRDD